MWLSALISKFAYLLVLCKYWLKRLRTKRRIISIPHDQAVCHISSVHPDPAEPLEVHTAEQDSSVDLSIIIPVYNYVNLIEANIQSVLNQKTNYTFQTGFSSPATNQLFFILFTILYMSM